MCEDIYQPVTAEKLLPVIEWLNKYLDNMNKQLLLNKSKSDWKLNVLMYKGSKCSFPEA